MTHSPRCRNNCTPRSSRSCTGSYLCNCFTAFNTGFYRCRGRVCCSFRTFRSCSGCGSFTWLFADVGRLFCCFSGVLRCGTVTISAVADLLFVRLCHYLHLLYSTAYGSVIFVFKRQTAEPGIPIRLSPLFYLLRLGDLISPSLLASGSP